MALLSSINRKIVSGLQTRWKDPYVDTPYAIGEVCPYMLFGDKSAEKRNEFWTTEGGACLNGDIDNSRLYVRGGEWRATFINEGEEEIIGESFLSFVKDGENFISLKGNANTRWDPYMSGSKFTDCFKMSKYRRYFKLKPQESIVQRFKIGAYPLNVLNFYGDKKGWPFLHTCFRLISGDRKNMTINVIVERNILFTDNTLETKRSESEIQKMKREWDALKTNLGISEPGPADTTVMQVGD